MLQMYCSLLVSIHLCFLTYVLLTDFVFLNADGLFTDTASEPFVWVA